MVALVDCNNFYASCERVFNLSLNNKPIVVLSNNDGCVVARSNESKALNIPMGASAFQYKDLFEKNNVNVFSSNYALYGDLSARVMNIISNFSPDVEVYSIDEAFIFFDGFENIDLQNHCKKLKNQIFKWTGIPVSIGISKTKALAKIANKIAKKYPEQTQGVYLMEGKEKQTKGLKWTRIEDVWGIGSRYAARLKNIKVNTAYEFTQLNRTYVRKEFSVVGLRLLQELQGIRTLEIEHPKNKKAIATTRSQKNDIYELEKLEERIATYAISCAEKLRKQKSVAHIVYVFVKTNRFKENQPQYRNAISFTMPYATSSSITITKCAKMALKSIFKEGYGYKKIGVILMGIVPENKLQLNLFRNENPKHKKLMQVIDQLNISENGKIKFGSEDLGRKWKMRQEKLSPKYTTQWSDILVVK